MCGSPIISQIPIVGAALNNPGLKTLMGTYTPGPSDAEKRGMMDAPRLAAEAAATGAAQAANAKLADRNRRRSASLLATGAGDTGMAQGVTASKTVLGA